MNDKIFREKSAVIDVGSNSVRLMLLADGKVLYKTLETTRLGEAFSKNLQGAAQRRTAEAIAAFVARAKSEGAKKIYAFATAAVREAENRNDFLSLVEKTSGLNIEVVSGETEAALGMSGALKNADGAVLDAGGASTELAVRTGGETAYKKSVPVGVVRLKDKCGVNVAKLRETCERAADEFADAAEQIKSVINNVTGIGGTATTLGAMKAGLKEYDGKAVTGVRITREETGGFADKLLSMPVEEIEKLPCMPKKRADVIGGGAAWLYAIMRRLNLPYIIVSDEDNLEGFARSKNLL
ncbi:MAG: hypothetical protein SPH68_03310 [Candidatus Borkfalkiaceae bacterium]|nr:hypothetical protein [Clostridia bacterium]MDY6223173.1 hypothetical protein [Christensenellaceae bacterium]